MNHTCRVGTRATILTPMNWVLLRRELQKLREDAGFSDAQLSRAITHLDNSLKLHKSSIGRIEDVEKRPKHNPNLQTIEAWAQACGITLEQLFARISGSQKASLNTRKASGTTALQSEPLGVSRDQNAPLPADDADRAELRRQIIHEIASLLWAATTHASRQATAPHAARSGSGSKVRSSTR